MEKTIDYRWVRCRAYQTRIIVDFQRGFLYCPIPKAANTAWKLLLSPQVPGKVEHVHSPSLSGFQYLANVSEEFQQKKHSLFKFIFVRDPYSRLLSTYKNKFEGLSRRNENQRNSFWVGFGQYIKAQLLSAGQQDNDESDLTFAEFVRFVCGQEPAEMDEHWHPQARMSCLEQINYDFVGKFEQLAQDVAIVFERLDISGKFPTHEEVRFPPTHAAEQIERYYDPELKAAVREKYEEDFRTFGY
jgi:hypothetical protein